MTFFIRIFYCLFGFSCTYAFLHLPPILTEKLIVSNLETIISSKAITSSIITNLQKEIDVERAILQLFPLHVSYSVYVYLSVAVTILYGQWKFYNGSQYDKLRKIEIFNKQEKFIKNIIFVFVMVFLKDVESVT